MLPFLWLYALNNCYLVVVGIFIFYFWLNDSYFRLTWLSLTLLAQWLWLLVTLWPWNWLTTFSSLAWSSMAGLFVFVWLSGYLECVDQWVVRDLLDFPVLKFIKHSLYIKIIRLISQPSFIDQGSIGVVQQPMIFPMNVNY